MAPVKVIYQLNLFSSVFLLALFLMKKRGNHTHGEPFVWTWGEQTSTNKSLFKRNVSSEKNSISIFVFAPWFDVFYLQ